MWLKEEQHRTGGCSETIHSGKCISTRLVVTPLTQCCNHESFTVKIHVCMYRAVLELSEIMYV